MALAGVPKTLEGSTKKISDGLSGANEQRQTYLQDIAMPHGDACRDNGTLKDAHEMTWLNSPSDEVGPAKIPAWNGPEFQDEFEQNNLTSAKVGMPVVFFNLIAITHLPLSSGKEIPLKSVSLNIVLNPIQRERIH